jgi:hypothetical protein
VEGQGIVREHKEARHADTRSSFPVFDNVSDQRSLCIRALKQRVADRGVCLRVEQAYREKLVAVGRMMVSCGWWGNWRRLVTSQETAGLVERNVGFVVVMVLHNHC